MPVWDLGEAAVSLAEFYDLASVLADPSGLTVTVTKPDASVLTFNYPGAAEILRLSQGLYRLTLTVDTPGQWLVRWDAFGGLSAVVEDSWYVAGAFGSPPVADPAPPGAWRPTVEDVADVLAQRTGDRAGDARATFTDDTVPSRVQAQGVIDQVMGEITLRVGTIPGPLATPTLPGGGPASSPAGRVATVGAAAWIELQFYPDLQLQGQGPAEQLWTRYQALLDGLEKAKATLVGGGAVDVPPRPTASFPASVAAGMGTTFWEPF